MKLFKTITKVEGCKEPMVDWYDAGTESEARTLWDEDCHRYGLPMAKTTVQFVECDPETLKPLDSAAELRRMIAGTVPAFADPKERKAALAAVQWRLRGERGEFVGLDKQTRCAFVPESEAQVFSGLDNEETKLRVYQAALGPLTIEILTQAK